jgi:hypothetical protein
MSIFSAGIVEVIVDDVRKNSCGHSFWHNLSDTKIDSRPNEVGTLQMLRVCEEEEGWIWCDDIDYHLFDAFRLESHLAKKLLSINQ